MSYLIVLIIPLSPLNIFHLCGNFVFQTFGSVAFIMLLFEQYVKIKVRLRCFLSHKFEELQEKQPVVFVEFLKISVPWKLFLFC